MVRFSGLFAFTQFFFQTPSDKCQTPAVTNCRSIFILINAQSIDTSAAFFDFAGTVCPQKLTKVVYLLQKLRTLVGVRNICAAFQPFNKMYLRSVLAFAGNKRLVLRQGQMTGIEDQRLAGDPCLWLVGLGKAAVNNEQLSARLYGFFSVLYLHGNMTVDYMTSLRVKPEHFKYPAADFRLL